jgi:hypothetical protein
MQSKCVSHRVRVEHHLEVMVGWSFTREARDVLVLKSICKKGNVGDQAVKIERVRVR